MIDISDGLASEVCHICNKNKLVCRIFEEKLTIDTQTLACEELQLNTSIAVLSGQYKGEDYELLFSIALKDYEKIKYQYNFSVIGDMITKEGDAKMITKEGKLVSITAQVWDNFLTYIKSIKIIINNRNYLILKYYYSLYKIKFMIEDICFLLV